MDRLGHGTGLHRFSGLIPVLLIACVLGLAFCVAPRIQSPAPAPSLPAAPDRHVTSARGNTSLPVEIDMLWRALQELVPDGRGGQRFLRPEEVVEFGGDIIAGGRFTGIPVDVPRTRRLRDDIARARQLATEQGVSLRLHVTSRPDHYVEQSGSGVVPGFHDAWILRSQVAVVREDRARFESQGWSIESVDFVSNDFLARVRETDAGQPNYYGPVEPDRRRYKINGVLVDLRNPNYRRWQLDWLESLVEFTGADGVAVPLKTGWHAYPMYHAKASPSGRHGGPLSDTSYGPGEYEAAVTAWVREARARGLAIYLQDSTPGQGGPDAWYPAELIEAIAGRYKPILVNRSLRLRRILSRAGT